MRARITLISAFFAIASSAWGRGPPTVIHTKDGSVYYGELVERVAFDHVTILNTAGEIKRFIDKFTLAGLIDREGKAFVDAGLAYLRASDAELLERIAKEPKLLRLPLVRLGNRISIGHDEAAWKEMAAA